MLRATVLLLLVTGGWLGLSCRVANAVVHPHCERTLRVLAESYNRREGAAPITVQDLRPGDWVVSEAHGLLRLSSLSPDGIPSFHGFNNRGTTTLPGFAQSRFARLGTEAAREILTARLHARFEHPENVEWFFAMKGITGSDGSPTIRNIGRAAWEAVRSAFPAFKDKSLEEVRVIWVQVLVNGLPNANIMNPDAIAAITAFTREFYRRTGHNLVQGGILSADWWVQQGDGRIHLGQGSRGGAPRHTTLGGNANAVPLDIFHELVLLAWRNSEHRLGELGAPHVSFVPYRPVHGAEPTGETKQILDFKETGDISLVQSLLSEGRETPAYAKWKKVVAVAGDSVVFVGVPSSSGRGQAVDALTRWVHADVGVGKIPISPIQIKGDTETQKSQSGLWGRIYNAGRREYVIEPNDVKDRVIVLVDDVVTSGASIEGLRRSLLAKGAKAVYVFSLAKTGAEGGNLVNPDFILPLLLTETAPPASSTLPTSKPELFRLVGERLAANETLPWSGKILKDLSPGDKKARSTFLNGFSALEFDLLAQMPLSALEKVDVAGKELGKDTPSFARSLEEDDVFLAGLVESLYRHRDNTRLLETELGKSVVTLAQAKLARKGPLRNQLRGSEAGEWIVRLPKEDE